jgi:hypothetical protein
MTGFLTTAPWPTLTFVGALYLGSIPLTIRAAMQARRAAAVRHSEPAAPPLPAAVVALPLGEASPPANSPPANSPPANEWRH